MSADVTRIVGWAIPLVCIGAAGYVLYTQHGELDRASSELVTAQREEAAASAAREQAEQMSGEMRFAAAPPSTTEEPKFLDGLRAQAAIAGVRVSRWNSQPQETAAPPSGGDAATVNPAIKNVVKIKGTMTVTGPYSGVRAFLSALGRSNRLYVFSDMRWTRKDQGDVELTTTITRFVDPTLTGPEGKGQNRT